MHHWVHHSAIVLYAVAGGSKDRAAEWDHLKLRLKDTLGLASGIL